MAGCSDQYNVNVQPCSAEDSGVVVNSPHIIQYPKHPRNDNARVLAIGSLIGAVIGRFANSDKLDEASDAEGKWKAINETLKDRGDILFAYATTERTRAALLDTCLNELHTQLCCYAQTGYIPDYQGILTRTQADIQTITSQKVTEMCQLADRYHYGANADLQYNIQREAIKALVGNVTKAREAERQFAFKTNWELLSSATTMVEAHRDGRSQSSRAFDSLGGDFLSSAGKNYAFLADSLRKTAQLDGNAWATLGGLIAGVIAIMSPCLLGDPEKCCEEETTSGGGGGA